jgi:hypothetical protein
MFSFRNFLAGSHTFFVFNTLRLARIFSVFNTLAPVAILGIRWPVYFFASSFMFNIPKLALFLPLHQPFRL